MKRVVIMGAAGKDFHTFNTCFRDNEDYKVVAFTATQIPDIDGRKYPAELAGKLYPDGIPIFPEEDLLAIMKEHSVNKVVFAYSDVSYAYVEEKRKKVESAGAEFSCAPVEETMLASSKPVIAVCAIRTGCGKSQTTRFIADILKKAGKKVAVVRHPMPYGNLVEQRVQKFESLDDLVKHKCTIEEMEEYEPHIMNGSIVFAGVDYEQILRNAESLADVILWDGGNNDTPFFKPALYFTVADPLRAGHELLYYPGKINFTSADVIIINKIDSARREDIEQVVSNARQYNSDAKILLAKSPTTVDKPELITGKRVVVVEDGPTVTHGDMGYGAGYVTAKQFNASAIVSPVPYAVGSLKTVFEKYSQVRDVLPAVGYSKEQISDLEKTLNNADCDTVVIGTPIDLTRIIKINKPTVRVSYRLEEEQSGEIERLIKSVL